LVELRGTTPRRNPANRNGYATCDFAIRESARKCRYVRRFARIAGGTRPQIATPAGLPPRASFVSANANFVLVRDGARPCASGARRFPADLSRI